MLDLGSRNPEVILVDDEQSELDAYGFLLRSMGVRKIHTIQDSTKVLDFMPKVTAPVVFLDLNMPVKSGQEVLCELKQHWPQVPVIICTANSEIETAIECLKLGAHDYLVKPISMDSFASALRTAMEISQLRTEVLSLKGVDFSLPLQDEHQAFGHIVTRNPGMTAIFKYIEHLGASTQPVLILGETGTGKELLAKAVHDVSGLNGEYVAVDVSGLDDTMFSDTLFGHVKGAYTGAVGVRSGLLEKAAGGTIFLDEIGELSEASQVKLLRVLQEGIYYPLGSDQSKMNSARVVAATNKNLTALSGQDGEFRRDLYYRLSTHLIKVPPLRERPEDLPILIDHLVAEAAAGMGKECPQMSRKALQLLVRHPFYGNVRELKTYLYDAVARCQGEEITAAIIAERLPEEIGTVAEVFSTETGMVLEKIFGHFPTLEELTEYCIDQALQATDDNQSQAAKLLGISKQALNKRVKKRHSHQ
ncbi:sigma-54 dependent transcriptional regulator [Malonomonas rubra]|uniref:sigma-54-dependent transcriptional regulator n=1 Tax=Malonomonas rubra TaxID=57040 RepID=UPI0026EDFC1C|nr:sigma-54 dependent transcriptional regulator [Malonomonas rubra]